MRWDSLRTLSSFFIFVSPCLVQPPSSAITEVISSLRGLWRSVWTARSYRAWVIEIEVVWIAAKFKNRIRLTKDSVSVSAPSGALSKIHWIASSYTRVRGWARQKLVAGLTGRSVHLSPSSFIFFFLSSNNGPTNFISFLSFLGLSKIYHETRLTDKLILVSQNSRLI